MVIMTNICANGPEVHICANSSGIQTKLNHDKQNFDILKMSTITDFYKLYIEEEITSSQHIEDLY